MTALSDEAGAVAIPADVAARLLRAIDRSPTMTVSLLDGDLRTQWISRSSEWVTDTDPDARTGRESLEVIHPDDIPRIIHGMSQLRTATQAGMGAKLTIEPLRYRRRRRDGTWITMEAIVQNFLDDPEVAGLLVISRPAGGTMDGVAHVVDLLVAAAPLPEVLTACARLVPDFLGTAAVVGVVEDVAVVGAAEDSPAARLAADERWWRGCLADGRPRTERDYAGFPDDLAARAIAEGYGCAWVLPLTDPLSGQVMGCVIVWV